MMKKTSTLLSLVLVITMLVALLPADMITLAAGEDDNSLLSLSYTFQGATTTIPLVADDRTPTIQQNRYTVTLPFITKTFAVNRLPVVSATKTNAGASVLITQAAAFPGTAKVAVTSASGQKRNYYVRFNYAPGAITNLSQKIGTTAPLVYPTFNDLQPMSLTDLRELYLDVNTLWETYCRSLTDRGPSGTTAIVDTPDLANSTKIPSTLAPLLAGKTGNYIQDYATYTPPATSSRPTPTPTVWANMWIATGVSTNSGTTVLNSSPYFDGATWIPTSNSDKGSAYMISAHPDAVTFTTNRGAWIWVANNSTTDYPNFTSPTVGNGWVQDTSVDKRMYHGDGSTYAGFFKKYFSAGTVQIPTYGAAAPARAPMIMVLWDAPGNGTTSLSSMTATVNGSPINIPVSLGQTTYDIALPAGTVPILSATPTDGTAEYDIIQATTFPGSATMKVLSGSNSATYTINFTIDKATPVVTWPTIKAINYGQTFANAISGGTGEGVFTIEDATVVPIASTVAYTKTITFTPTDLETYKVLTQVVEITVNALKNGDINSDGIIDISDVIMVAEISVGYTNYLPAQITRANVSSKIDPTVDIADVVLIAERAVGSTTTFPVDEQ